MAGLAPATSFLKGATCGVLGAHPIGVAGTSPAMTPANHAPSRGTLWVSKATEMFFVSM